MTERGKDKTQCIVRFNRENISMKEIKEEENN